ncbi:DUF2383 domain-containing protein [Gilvimarinus sp. F26214L]|uniref:DUF2383 domain-containing protein n=1 Tax=Gilvimarinus sp. DZF01 TaxID=3461371 RepID=UPI004045FE43
MDRESEALHKLLWILSKGNEFYRDARERIQDRDLATFFSRNLAERERIERQLRPFASLAEVESINDEDIDLELRLEEYRSRLLAALNDNDAYVYIDHLGELEERSVVAYREALASAEGDDLREALSDLKPEFEQMLDRARAARGAAGHRESPTTLATRFMR